MGSWPPGYHAGPFPSPLGEPCAGPTSHSMLPITSLPYALRPAGPVDMSWCTGPWLGALPGDQSEQFSTAVCMSARADASGPMRPCFLSQALHVCSPLAWPLGRSRVPATDTHVSDALTLPATPGVVCVALWDRHLPAGHWSVSCTAASFMYLCGLWPAPHPFPRASPCREAEASSVGGGRPRQAEGLGTLGCQRLPGRGPRLA